MKATYRGIKGTEFIWRGTQSDPLIRYRGEEFNYYDIEDALWEDFKEAGGDTEDPFAFDKWVEKNEDVAIGYLDGLLQREKEK